jgi:D-threonate/D-erythronate kinase
MIETLVIADDLSGAADCAVACVSSGLATTVLIDIQAAPTGAEVVAVDVNSRTMAPDKAGAAAAAAVATLCSPGTRVLYQKIDSTLRGNWAHELVHIRNAVAQASSPPPIAIIAPAFPGAGRTTVNGRVRVDGMPLEQTETWKHEGGTGPSDLGLKLSELGLIVERASLDEVRAGVDRFRERLSGWASKGVEAVVCDAELDPDLDAIAGASLSLKSPRIFVGSAGLMRALVSARGFPSASAQASLRMQVSRPVLIAVGSASQFSHGQFKTLAGERDVAVITIAPSTLRQEQGSEDLRRVRQALGSALSSGVDVAVSIDPQSPIHLREAPSLVAALAGILAPMLPRVGGLVVTGGETARAILVRSGVSGLQMRGEIEPGVPLGISIGQVAIPVVTKAGAFGNPLTLVRARAALHVGEVRSSDRSGDGTAANRDHDGRPGGCRP